MYESMDKKIKHQALSSIEKLNDEAILKTSRNEDSKVEG